MIRNIGLKSEDFVIKDKFTKRGIRDSRKYDINAIEADELKIVGFDFGTARIIVGDEEYFVPKSKMREFRNVIGKRNRGVVKKTFRFKFEKKPEKKVPYIVDIWENTGVPTQEDAVLIGEKVALFLTGKSDIIDISSEQSKDRTPFMFVSRMIRVPKKIAFERGYNISNNRDLRLRVEGKVVGEVMYKCGALYEKPDGDNVDICFGVKIREKKGKFIAEKIARIIDRQTIGGEGQAVQKGKLTVSRTNLDVDDFVISSKFIDSDDTDREALKLFEDFEFEELKDTLWFFDYKPEETVIRYKTSRGKFKTKVIRNELPSRMPLLELGTIEFKSAISDFNSFIDGNIKPGSGLDSDKIKSKFGQILQNNIKQYGAFYSSYIKSLSDLYNDVSIFTENKTSRNPVFYDKLNKFIGGKVVQYSKYKEYIEGGYE